MVEPQYVRGKPKKPVFHLSGNILIFGSGHLTHEKMLFGFRKPTRIVLYDPITKTDASFHPKAVYCESLDDALKGGKFENIVCLFSLHYEPQWLFTLERLLEKLEPKGTIYFAEDKGFRALLDNNSGLQVIQLNRANGELGKIISAAFREREIELAAPWYPDISASDYDLVFEILSFVGERAAPRRFGLTRRYDPHNEPQCYLPWKSEANPAITDDWLIKFKQSLPTDATVHETIEITAFRKDRALPRLHNINSDPTRAIWHLVARHASERIGKVRAPPDLQHDKARKARDRFAKTFLHTAYLNYFRHFGSIGTAEIIIGFHSNFGTEKVATALTFDPHLPPCTFSSNERRLRMTFETPDFLARYIAGRQSRSQDGTQPRYVAHELCDRGAAGVFLWGPPKRHWWPHREDVLPVKNYHASLVDLRAKDRSAEDTKLFDLCTEWGVPLCLYMLGSLGYTGSAGTAEITKEKIAAACVVYFIQNEFYRSDPEARPPSKYDDAHVMADVDALVFASPGLIIPLAGLSAYLELAHKEDFLQELLVANPNLLDTVKAQYAQTQIETFECRGFKLTIGQKGWGVLKKNDTVIEGRLHPGPTATLREIFASHNNGNELVFGATCIDAAKVSKAKTEHLRLNKIFKSTTLWETVIKSARRPDGRIRRGQYYIDKDWQPSPASVPANVPVKSSAVPVSSPAPVVDKAH